MHIQQGQGVLDQIYIVIRLFFVSKDGIQLIEFELNSQVEVSSTGSMPGMPAYTLLPKHQAPSSMRRNAKSFRLLLPQ